jgi:hypothetical protein
MHWFQLNKDETTGETTGELELNFPWLPYWIVHNPDVLDVVKKEAQGVLPKDLMVSQLEPEHYTMLDDALIAGLQKALPYVDGLRPFMKALTEMTLDPSKAPKANLKGKQVHQEPKPPWDPLEKARS